MAETVVKEVNFDPAVWAALERQIPAQAREGFINDALRSALDSEAPTEPSREWQARMTDVVGRFRSGFAASTQSSEELEAESQQVCEEVRTEMYAERQARETRGS
jgi:hypothetical protein